MKKKKLFTTLAAAVMLTSSAVALVENQTNTNIVQAAAKKSSKKAKYATIKIKSGALAYKIKFNKQGTKVSKITALKKKGKKQQLKGGKSIAIWSTTYKKVKYYYIGTSGKNALVVRAKDAKRTSKKKVPSLSSLVKKAVAKRQAKVDQANAQLKSKANDLQSELNAMKPKTYTGKVSQDTVYFNVDDSGKATNADSNMTANTALTIYFKITDALETSSGSKVDAYYAKTNDDKVVIVPASAVSVDNASQIPDQATYENAVKKYNDFGADAKQQIEDLKNQLEKSLS